MLGRRQIREKVVQSLYSYHQNAIKVDDLETKMFRNISSIYDLYVYELNFFVALRQFAENQIEIAKNKFLKVEQTPNLKFIRNQVLENIENNQERLSHTSKNANLKWDMYETLLGNIFKKMKNGKRYQDFMQEEVCSFDEDQKFVGKLFLRYMAENEDFREFIEEKEISWTDNFHIANSMVQKTIGFMKANEPMHTLMKVFRNHEDKNFASKLLRDSVAYFEETEKEVESYLENWDLERVSLMDKLILICAITELKRFPLTPSRVILNEYIDIAKDFSTDKSQIFVNGILNRYVKENNRI